MTSGILSTNIEPCLTCPVQMVCNYENQLEAEINERGKPRIRTLITLFLSRQNLLGTRDSVAKLHSVRDGNYRMAYECERPSRSLGAFVTTSNAQICEAIVPIKQ